MKAVLGLTGLVWAQPVADLLSTALVAGLYLWTSRRIMGENFDLQPILLS